MKALLTLLLLVLATTTMTAQTKRIAHRSHSGSDNSLTLDGSSNFGLSPEPHYWMEPDTVPTIDSSLLVPVPKTVPATAPTPAPDPPKAQPSATEPPQQSVEPSAPQKPAAPSGNDSLEVPSTTPTISEGNHAVPSTTRAESVPVSEHSESGRLTWLALALVFPATGLVLFGAMRRKRSDVG